MKITIEAEPKEMATIVAELQKQPETSLQNANGVVDAFNELMRSYEEKLRARNPEVQT